MTNMYVVVVFAAIAYSILSIVTFGIVYKTSKNTRRLMSALWPATWVLLVFVLAHTVISYVVARTCIRLRGIGERIGAAYTSLLTRFTLEV